MVFVHCCGFFRTSTRQRRLGWQADADAFVDDVDNEFVELVSVRRCEWLFRFGAGDRTGLDFRISQIAPCPFGELDGEGFGELSEFGSAFAYEFFGRAGLELEESAPGLGSQENRIGFAELGRIFHLTNE